MKKILIRNRENYFDIKQKIFLILFSVFLILSFGAFKQILACECVDFKPEETYNIADIVFAGVDIDGNGSSKLDLNSKPYISDSGKSIFEVTENFLGTKKGDKIQVQSRDRPCVGPMEFIRGVEYLVYATQNADGSYSTGHCLRTNCIHCQRFNASEDLNFLRNELPKRTTSKIFGKFYRRFSMDDKESLDGILFVGIGIKIKDLINRERTYFTKSDGNGRFNIELPPGSYRVEVESPAKRQVSEQSKEELNFIKIRLGGAKNLPIELEKTK